MMQGPWGRLWVGFTAAWGLFFVMVVIDAWPVREFAAWRLIVRLVVVPPAVLYGVGWVAGRALGLARGKGRGDV
ncbi:MAG: hypothetical protein ABI051_04280 [Vicinamibacterales bacterium]